MSSRAALVRCLVPLLSMATIPSMAGAQGRPAAAARADSILRAAEQHGFSGVARIEKDGAVILEKGYGLANRAERIPFAPATVVQIGSNTKDFTIVAILQLHERGVLSIHDSIGKYFANAPADKRNITIAHLLDHRAGFPHGLGGDFEVVSRDDLIRNAMARPLLFSPGTNETYSNTGYSLLAAIIEQVAGTTYDLYVRDHILAPLGLTRTGFLLPNYGPRDLAHGYRADGSDAGTMLAKPHAPDGPYWNLRGNGGMLSTVGDMAVFYTALFESERLMRATTRALRWDPKEQIALAGSDNVNFFVYERDPEAGLEMHIASTNAEYKAPVVRRELSRALAERATAGRANAPERRVVTTTEGPTRQPAAGRVSPAVTAMVNELVATLNRMDAATLRAFIERNFVASPDGPTIDQRVERLGTFRSGAGALGLVSISPADNGVDAELSSENEGRVVMRIELESPGSQRIRGIRIQIGTG